MKQTDVSLRYMMDFGSSPLEKNLLLSAQFLHQELAIRIARRAIELENRPFGLSEKSVGGLQHLVGAARWRQGEGRWSWAWGAARLFPMPVL